MSEEPDMMAIAKHGGGGGFNPVAGAPDNNSNFVTAKPETTTSSKAKPKTRRKSAAKSKATTEVSLDDDSLDNLEAMTIPELKALHEATGKLLAEYFKELQELFNPTQKG